MQDKTRIVIFVFVESRENPRERGVGKKTGEERIRGAYSTWLIGIYADNIFSSP